jgi:hypothetical protein
MKTTRHFPVSQMTTNMTTHTDWATVDYTVCVVTPLPGITKKTATCARCSVTVYYSSAIPATVRKICELCARQLMQKA